MSNIDLAVASCENTVIGLYGTLREGEVNHRVISKLINEGECKKIELKDGAKAYVGNSGLVLLPHDIPTLYVQSRRIVEIEGVKYVAVDLYDVTDRAIGVLDYFEGAPTFFSREMVRLQAPLPVLNASQDRPRTLSVVTIWAMTLKTTDTYPLVTSDSAGVVDWAVNKRPASTGISRYVDLQNTQQPRNIYVEDFLEEPPEEMSEEHILDRQGRTAEDNSDLLNRILAESLARDREGQINRIYGSVGPVPIRTGETTGSLGITMSDRDIIWTTTPTRIR